MAAVRAWMPSLLRDGFATREEVEFVASPPQDAKTVVVVGLKPNVEALRDSDALTALMPNEASRHGILSRLSPSRDAPSTAETTVFGSDGAWTRYVAVALPTDCSRHNSPARPAGIFRAMQNLSLGGDSGFPVAVLLVLDDAKYAVAAGSAVARAFPAFSAKSQKASEDAPVRRIAVSFGVAGVAQVDPDSLDRLNEITRSIRLAAALVDMPTSMLHTDAFVGTAQSVASEVGATGVTVIAGTELRDRGFGGLWGVGQASAHLPALVVLEHRPEGVAEDAASICMAGKGIVYDTGGLSLKSPAFMPGMKRDMGGAAAVLGAFRAIARNGGCGRRVCALLCLAENSVSKEATRPDDVLHMYSGKTVEVNNTDAEGRLVLADGVAYAVKHLNPEYVIDIATLTGAQGISTGKNHGALYCNSDELEGTAVQAGKLAGELVHPLPFAPEFYRSEFSSVVADMKNSVKNRANAQSSCAGQFIGNHLGDFLYDGKWLHIDIAFPSFDGERGTGFGVGLLTELVRHL